jgi:hypothetical protein
MRAIPLLCGFFIAASLLCYGTDPASTPTTPEMNSPARASIDAGAWRQRRSPSRQSFVGDTDGIPRSENVCLMLRTYIVVREDRDSDVTRRDGELVCQPAWKFQTKSAVGSIDNR